MFHTEEIFEIKSTHKRRGPNIKEKEAQDGGKAQKPLKKYGFSLTPTIYCITVHLNDDCIAISDTMIHGQGENGTAFRPGASTTIIGATAELTPVIASLCEK
jgi:hypothetical protein